jgi:hypothetical protein
MRECVRFNVTVHRMSYLNHPPIQRLIQSVPVADHSVAVAASRWQSPCAAAGRPDLHAAVFAGQPEVRISRGWLLEERGVDPEVRCLAILLWGYPTGARGNLHVQWLRNLRAIAAAAAAPAADWPEYHRRLAGAGPLGISTISKLAHFFGHTFDGRRALILDRRILTLCAAGRWTEFAPLADLTYVNAARRYPDYLGVMHVVAEAGQFSPEQLEFFLFSLGEAF